MVLNRHTFTGLDHFPVSNEDSSLHITFFQSNLSEFFCSTWCYTHQNPKEAMNPSNSTICIKLQAQKTKPLELQQLTKNTHTMYLQTTTLLEKSIFFIKRLLEIHLWSSNSQISEVCCLKKNGCCLHSVGATNTAWSAINAIWFF